MPQWRRVDTHATQDAYGVVEAWRWGSHSLLKINASSAVLWELRNSDNKVLMTQYELPEIASGAPLSWATYELRLRGIR